MQVVINGPVNTYFARVLGFASFAQGSSAPEHSYMKMAMSEASKAAFELGMEISGSLAPVTEWSSRAQVIGALPSHGSRRML